MAELATTCSFPLYLMPAVAGNYELHFSSSDPNGQSYKVEVNELHPAAATDNIRAAAGQVLLEAYGMDRQDSSSPQAKAKYEEAISVFENAGDLRGQAMVYGVLSCRSRAAQDYPAAVDYLQHERVLWHSLDRHDAEAGTLHSMSLMLQRMGKVQEALECLNDSLQLVGDARSEAATLE